MEHNTKKVSTKVFVETPEQIDFAFEVAGIGPRIAAYLLDLVIRVVAIFIVSLFVVFITGGAPFGLGVIVVLLFVVEWGYFTLIEWRNDGVTPGKKALGLRVVRTNGVSLDLYRSAMRNLLRAADGFPPLFAFIELFPFPSYAVAIFVIFVTGTGRRLGDLAADTMVVIEDRARLDKLPPLPANAVQLSSHAIAAAGVTAKDMAHIDAFFRRRRFFSPQRSRELAEILAKPMSLQLGVTYEEPEAFLAGVLLGGHDERSSYTGIEGILRGRR